MGAMKEIAYDPAKRAAYYEMKRREERRAEILRLRALASRLLASRDYRTMCELASAIKYLNWD